jgi:hypothetical protein
MRKSFKDRPMEQFYFKEKIKHRTQNTKPLVVNGYREYYNSGFVFLNTVRKGEAITVRQGKFGIT